MDFQRILKTLGQELADKDVRFGVVGGVALAAYGIARMTIDLDLVIDGDNQEPAIGTLESLGYETLHRSRGYSNHQHADSTFGRVDVVYVRGTTSQQLFEACRRLDGPGGVEILVPAAEHLAAMKVVAMKNDPDRLWQDLADIRQILTLPGVDRQAIRASFDRHGLTEHYRELEKKI